MENAKDAKSQDQASKKEDEGDEIEDNRFFMQRNDSSYTMSDDQAVLSPAKVRGFSLTDKKWAFFLVDNATDIQWLEDPMERLEIDGSSKKVINALVTAHGRRRSSMDAQFQDIIPGKGLGLVFLFAGDPGLGKTLTAEVVSEHRKKALYAITSGELGIETAAADQRMRTIFDRAKAWDAYLLLDEADVFLAERDRDNLSRNGLVTGKLTRLFCCCWAKYKADENKQYSCVSLSIMKVTASSKVVFSEMLTRNLGVIFLTTNRLTAFDPAFESRIQCKLFYDPLTPIQRTRIWRTLLPRRLSRDNEPLEWDENVLRTLGASHNINGREIKNMIVAALALAEAEGESLGEKHLNHVRAINETWAAKAEGET
jgi:SpoVK/Ycf46/Vps4 family AAA+-type ATPase